MVPLAWILAAAAAEPDVLAQIDRAQRELYGRVAPTVVYVITRNGFGSGVTLSADGLVLTNEHVVRGAETVDAVTLDGRRLRGRVVERAAGVDLALVQLDGEGLAVARLATGTELAVGQWVAAVGHAEGGGWSFTTGTVSNLYTASGGQAVFQTQIPLNHGNSGGPVVDREGRVVGIVTAGLAGAQNLNFAIRIDVATRSLEGLEDACDCLVIHAPAGVPVFVDGSAVGVGPRVTTAATRGAHTVFAIIGGRKVERTVQWPEVKSVTLEP